MDPKDNQTAEQLAAALEENKQLKARLAERDQADKAAAETTAAVREKMAAGLTRDQAESVVKQQREHDAHLAKLEADRADAAKAAKAANRK